MNRKEVTLKLHNKHVYSGNYYYLKVICSIIAIYPVWYSAKNILKNVPVCHKKLKFFLPVAPDSKEYINLFLTKNPTAVKRVGFMYILK